MTMPTFTGATCRGSYVFGTACDKCERCAWERGKMNVCYPPIKTSENKSVLQDWLMKLPLRAQGTLLTGFRGCDTAPKDHKTIVEKYGCSTGENAERGLTAFLRFCCLNPADPREVDIPGAWFQSEPPCDWKPSQFGHYPLHWYSHVMHCFEIVGYCHPSLKIKVQAERIYFRMVTNLHLQPENKSEMLARLTEDRIANNSVVN